MIPRRTVAGSYAEKELPALRLLSVITTVWFLAAGGADVFMGYLLLAILDFFLATMFLFFRLRMEAMSPSAVRGFIPPILLFLNLLPLGGSFLEADLRTLLLRHMVTLLGTGIYLEFRRRDVFLTYLFINAFSFAGAFILSRDSSGDLFNLAICYIFILSSMYFFSSLHRAKTRELEALSSSEKEAKKMALRDPLTGLFNRRHFDDELARLLKTGTDVSLFLLDLDNFKTINDTYGHPGGDEVLKSLASCINRTVRKGDIVCRIGGDEFAVLLPTCPDKNGRIMAENLCRHTQLCSPPLSVSIGTAHAMGGSFPEEVFKKADEALYAAKALGKRCVIHGGCVIPRPSSRKAGPTEKD